MPALLASHHCQCVDVLRASSCQQQHMIEHVRDMLPRRMCQVADVYINKCRFQCAHDGCVHHCQIKDCSRDGTYCDCGGPYFVMGCPRSTKNLFFDNGVMGFNGFEGVQGGGDGHRRIPMLGTGCQNPRTHRRFNGILGFNGFEGVQGEQMDTGGSRRLALGVRILEHTGDSTGS